MALSASTARKTRGNKEKGYLALGTGAVVYNGSLLCINESTGRAVAATAAAARTFIGVASVGQNQASLTGNTAGTVYVEYNFGHQEQFPSATALTKAYTGCNVAVLDDNRVQGLSAAGTAGVRVAVGELVEPPVSNLAWVWVRRYSTKSLP